MATIARNIISVIITSMLMTGCNIHDNDSKNNNKDAPSKIENNYGYVTPCCVEECMDKFKVWNNNIGKLETLPNSELLAYMFEQDSCAIPKTKFKEFSKIRRSYINEAIRRKMSEYKTVLAITNKQEYKNVIH